MKKYIYFISILLFLSSCSKESSLEVKNEKPIVVSNLIYPTYNLLCVTNILDFKWEASSDPNGDNIVYVLEISKDNLFLSIEKTYTVEIPTQRVTLETGVAYYWRVGVKEKDSENLSSDYSEVSKLYTEGPGIVNHLPFSPELIAPQITSFLEGNTTNLVWRAADVDNDVLSYDVYFGTENPPTEKVASNQNQNNLSVDLKVATTYYWKVDVNDGKGGVSIGQIWNFSTN